jgi:hypothetical protein
MRPRNARLEPAVTSEKPAGAWGSHSKKSHTWERTGRERIAYGVGPGLEYENRCENCGDVKWGSKVTFG